MRQCGGCTLCCKLLPVHGDARVDGVDLPGNFYKPAGERCPHQRFKKGCAVYNKPGMPTACKVWNCRWLRDPEAAGLPRPDRARYVVDMVPDVITVTYDDVRQEIEVVQVWVDPAAPDAWRDPALLAYLMRLGERGIAALIRYNSSDAFTLFPPAMASDGQWHEFRGGTIVPECSPAEQIARLERAQALK